MIEINGIKYNTTNIAYAYKKDETKIVYVTIVGSELEVEYTTEAEREAAFEAISF